MCNFIADLLGDCASAKEEKRLAGSSYGDKSLMTKTIYKILKQIKDGKNTDDRRKFNLKKTVHSAALIAAVAADVQADCRICIKTLPLPMGWLLARFLPSLVKSLGS
jgi:hypothetical protein